jgi:serine phosphatase RsbU (regulator of sigma subunit)
MVDLLITQGPDVGRKYRLDGGVTILGRQSDCTICLPAKAVSRQHAQIVQTGDGYHVEDLHSSNGSYLNGERLSPNRRVPLTDRDKFEIGPYTFSLRSGATPAATEGHVVIREQVSAAPSNPSVLGPDAAQKLQTVLEISHHLSRTLDIEQLVDKLLEQLLRLFPLADRGLVLLGEPDHLLVRGQRCRHQEDPTTHSYSRTIVQKALKEGVGILSDDIRGDSRFQASSTITSLEFCSLLCVPLMGPDQKRLGVIQLDRTRAGRAFTLEDLQLLTTIGLHVGVVLDNAAMHEEVLREQRFKQELALAQEIQQGYLPTDFAEFSKSGIEVFARVHAARQVSGDLYDLMEVKDGRLAFFLGDVSGKGMPAALFMVAVHALGRLLAAAGDSPAVSLTRLNGALASDNAAGMFVTVVHGVIQRETGEIVLSAAGHPPPLLRRANGTVEIPVVKTGRLLGYPDVELQLNDTTLTLERDELLVFFTDGFTEARSPGKREMFGIDRLRDVVAGFDAAMPLAACVDKAKAAIERHSGSAELQDDLTMLLIRRSGEQPHATSLEHNATLPDK